MDILNLSSNDNFHFDPLFKVISFPLYPSTYIHLGIEFKEIDHFMIRVGAMIKNDVIRKYCEGYRKMEIKLLEDTVATWNPY